MPETRPLSPKPYMLATTIRWDGWSSDLRCFLPVISLQNLTDQTKGATSEALHHEPEARRPQLQTAEPEPRNTKPEILMLQP